MSNLNIVYYFVPREEIFPIGNHIKIDKEELINWSEIMITEAEEIFERKGFLKMTSKLHFSINIKK